MKSGKIGIQYLAETFIVVVLCVWSNDNLLVRQNHIFIFSFQFFFNLKYFSANKCSLNKPKFTFGAFLL